MLTTAQVPVLRVELQKAEAVPQPPSFLAAQVVWRSALLEHAKAVFCAHLVSPVHVAVVVSVVQESVQALLDQVQPFAFYAVQSFSTVMVEQAAVVEAYLA